MPKYTAEYQQVNKVLKEWNPIGVPEPALSKEYSDYIPEILEKLGDEKSLIEYLENLLINIIGLDYNHNNKNHHQDVLNVVKKLKRI